jgi:hypothetical protein
MEYPDDSAGSLAMADAEINHGVSPSRFFSFAIES